jgi:hypothetical protein
MELKRNKIVGEKKKDDENDVTKKFNMTSNVAIEDPFEGDGDVLCNVYTYCSRYPNHQNECY